MVGDDIAWIQAGRARPSVRHQSRGGRVRRGARDVGGDQSERHGDDRDEHDLHERRGDARRRRLVGGHDRRASGRGDRLARTAVDARDRPGHRRARGASERAVHRARAPVSDHRSPTGRIRAACRSARSSSAAGARQRFRSCTRRSTGRRASTPARRWDRRRRPRRPARSAAFGATRWRCCRSAAITWATTSGTGSGCSGRSPRRRRCST